MNKVKFMKYAIVLAAAVAFTLTLMLIPGRGERLQRAIWDDNIPKAEEILKKGVGPKDKWYGKAIHDAILYEPHEVFEIFAAYGEEVFTGEHLMLAAEYGRADVVRAFINSGFDINAAYENGETALMKAAGSSDTGHLEAVRLLVEGGAELNAVTDHGMTPFMAAAGERDVVSRPGYYNDTEKRIAAAEEIMRMVQRDSDRGLLRAAEKGSVVKMREALEDGACINTRDRNGYTPLHLAAGNNHARAVKMLLEKGADVEPPHVRDVSPLHMAVKGSGDAQVCELLIDGGAAVDTADTAYSAILTDTLLKKRYDILQYLISRGADPDYSREYGSTAMMAAAMLDDIQGLDILLRAHASVDMRDAMGRNALFYAAESSSLKALKYLVAYGGDVNSMIDDEKGFDHHSSLLMYAARWGTGMYGKKQAMLTWLVDEGADVNAQNAGGETALIQCSKKNDIEMASLILKLGADPDIRDDKGKSALDHAREKGYLELAGLLGGEQP